MKKVAIAGLLLCSGMLALSGCGDDKEKKEMQSKIDEQTETINSLKSSKEKIEKEKNTANDKLKKVEEDNKKKDKEISDLKKVLASKKANNNQTQQEATSTQQNQDSSQQSNTAQQSTATSSSTPQFANEAEAEAYYDSFVDHDARVKEILEREKEPALTHDGQKIYDQYGNVLSEAERQESIENGEGDPVVQAETAQKQHQWAKEHGLE